MWGRNQSASVGVQISYAHLHGLEPAGAREHQAMDIPTPVHMAFRDSEPDKLVGASSHYTRARATILSSWTGTKLPGFYSCEYS